MDFLAVLSDNDPREGSKPKLLGIGRIANWSSSKHGITLFPGRNVRAS
jgi:hypothetical protein